LRESVFSVSGPGRHRSSAPPAPNTSQTPVLPKKIGHDQ
jgi:hypothetical protein